MYVAGLVVYGAPHYDPQLRERILQVPGAEVHATTGDGRFVVTIEREREDDLDAALNQIVGLPGVLASALVYHYCDSNDSLEESNDSDATRIHQE